MLHRRPGIPVAVGGQGAEILAENVAGNLALVFRTVCLIRLQDNIRPHCLTAMYEVFIMLPLHLNLSSRPFGDEQPVNLLFPVS